MIRRVGAAVLSAACALLAVWLASHHPLSPPLALLACAVVASVTVAWPASWPLWLLALLPLIGLAPWTGWLVVEELDIAVLAVAAAGYLRLAFGWPRQPELQATRSLAPVFLWFLPLLMSILISLQRGVADAGGLTFSWWQGYREPLNSLRLAKPIFEVLLLLPLWRASCRAGAAAVGPRLVAAMALLLLGVALGVVWERLAYTGLLDFSSDYRATGPFWEMHVGGAGLDAALALSMPFAVAALAAARTPQRWGAAAALLVLGLYASLVTFSRIVYAAVPMGVFVWWALRALAARRQGGVSGAVRGPWPGLVGLAAFAGLAAWCFPASGYRGLLALLGTAALALPLSAVLRRLAPVSWILGAGFGVLGVGLVALTAAGVPKGAYAAYALVWGTAAALLWRSRSARGSFEDMACLAAFVATLGGLVAVGVNWGGPKALASSAGSAALLGLAVIVAGLRRQPSWPESWPWQGQLLGAMVAAAATVGVFGGGAYMGGRMASSEQDSHGRYDHWRHALELLNTTDWALGKGLGRYWANQSLTGLPDDQTGDYRLLPSRGGHAMVLTSGGYMLGWGELFRLSQRVALPAPGPVTLRLDLRIDRLVTLKPEVCDKHLIYGMSCIGAEVYIKPSDGQWQAVEIPLKGDTLYAGSWFAPRLHAFALGLGRSDDRAEIDNLHLVDSRGTELLRNGDFEDGLARWYVTSDRYHLPWHIKNQALHLVFEQGLFGLAAFALAVAAALWRLSFGAARQHVLAPALAAAVIGLLIVGLVDSIFDMPRVAFLTLLLLGVALALPGGTGAPPAIRRQRRHRRRGPKMPGSPAPAGPA